MRADSGCSCLRELVKEGAASSRGNSAPCNELFPIKIRTFFLEITFSQEFVDLKIISKNSNRNLGLLAKSLQFLRVWERLLSECQPE